MRSAENKKESFVFYFDWLNHLSLLEPSAALKVLQSLRSYVASGEVGEMDSASFMAFSFIRAQVDRDMEKWENTRKERSKAGKAGAEATNTKRQKMAKSANADFAEQDTANPAVTVPVTVPVPVNVTVPNRVGDNKADKPPRTRFVPPTVEQVAEYVKQRGSKVDPQGFIDFYASKGWVVGKTPMKDWRAACRNAESWERWDKKPDSRNAVKTAADYDD